MALQIAEIESVIYEIHDFFTDWVGGRCPGDEATFKSHALDRISDDLVAIFPAGRKFGKEDFKGYMSGIHGSNPDFKIKIRNVEVAHLGDDMAVANYEEWQRNAKDSEEPNNGRLTTMVLGRHPSGNGAQILQVHETWLPEDVVAKNSFDF